MKLKQLSALTFAWVMGMTLSANGQNTLESPSPLDSASEYEKDNYDPDTSEAEFEETDHESHAIEEPNDTMTSSASSASRGMNVPGAQQSKKTFPVLDSKAGGMGSHPFIGINTGYQNVKGDVNSAMGFGADVGATFFGPVTAGLAIQFAPSDINVGDLKANFDTTNYLAWANYNFGGDIRVIKDTFIGWKLGLSRYSGATDTNTNLALGPSFGMNFQVDRAGKLTLGPEASYLTVADAPDQASLQAALRYWF